MRYLIVVARKQAITPNPCEQEDGEESGGGGDGEMEGEEEKMKEGGEEEMEVEGGREDEGGRGGGDGRRKVKWGTGD